jgi:PAS domain S-box-containing protein
VIQAAAVIAVFVVTGSVGVVLAQRASDTHAAAIERDQALLADVSRVRDGRLDVGAATTLYALTADPKQLADLRRQRVLIRTAIGRLEVTPSDIQVQAQRVGEANAKLVRFANGNLLPLAGTPAADPALARYHRAASKIATRLHAMTRVVESDIQQTEATAHGEQTRFLYASLVALLLGVAAVTTFAQRTRGLLRELEQQGRLYRLVVERSRDPIVITDQTGAVVYQSPAALALDGGPVTGGAIDRTHPDDREETSAAIRRATADGESGLFLSRRMIADGSYVILEGFGTAIEEDDAGKTLLLWVFRDVTRRQRLQEQLIQSQKMEAVGSLASGVAHDFNNILTAVIGNAELAAMASDASEQDECLRDVVRAADRGQELTAQLLSFARGGSATGPVEHLDLETITAANEGLLRRLVPSQIDLRFDLDTASQTVAISRTRLDQILLNLVVNAADAIGDETGAITVAARTDNNAVVLEVHDTGIGMSDETRARIFEPFFTTKETGKGTGIGLASVFTAVDEAGGQIDVDSTLGTGSTFRIRFPEIAGEQAA